MNPHPARITMALDLAGLHGPEVDAALGVPEPTVDEWEAGWSSPTPRQVRRLAMLTGFGPEFFYLPPLVGPRLRVFFRPSTAAGREWTVDR